MKVAVPLYTLGVVLLVAVALFGITKKGATRWVNVGVVIQPSELLKIATPLMLAWWFQRREGNLRASDFVIAFVLLMVPVGLIMKQPDLGTSLLVMAAGLSVIFLPACPGSSSCRPCCWPWSAFSSSSGLNPSSAPMA
jgi:rod shape determining protein RodA